MYNRYVKVYLFAVVYLLVMLSYGVGGALAQDTFSTNTPAPEVTAEVTVVAAPVVATDAPVVIPTPQPEQPPVVTDAGPSDRVLMVIGVIISMLFSMGVIVLKHGEVKDLVKVVNNALDNKNLQDEARERYMQSSLSTQETVKFLESALRLLSVANLPVVDPMLDKAANVMGKVTASNN